MFQRHSFYRLKWVSLCLFGVGAVSSGLSCPGTTPGDPTPNPTPAGGNTAPRLIITNIVTDQGGFSAQKGDPVIIQFIGEDAEDTATVRIFASTSSNPSANDQIEIANGFEVGPGFGSGSAQWDTTDTAIGAYNIYGEIDDHTFDPITGLGNPPVRVTFTNLVSISPKGSSPLTTPPQLQFVDPRANLGLSTGDEVTIRYVVADPDSGFKVTLLLDKDRIPTNDDVDNPGDPLDPATNIILLPSAPRLPTDPTFDGDPPPPDNIANPPQQPDSLELRTNPREYNATAPGQPVPVGSTLAGELKEYRFVIDFAQIPVRSQPYFLRATINDGSNVVHQYAIGSLTISSLASGTVDTAALGFALAGARFQGFAEGENFGTDFVAVSDLDNDTVEDFMVASRFGSPLGRFQSGAAYLIFGRRKLPFPPDSNNNGLPDVITPNGPVDFPVPPAFLPSGYDASNVGRFGGIISINSVNSFFRGVTYPMPEAHGSMSPSVPQLDPNHLTNHTAGLTSITRIDMTGDGIPDLVFGLPYVSGAYDFQDDDPSDGCGVPYRGLPQFPLDLMPNNLRCNLGDNGDNIYNGFTVDDFGEVNQGLSIMVDGSNDIRNVFTRFVDACMAGQFDPNTFDDEEILRGEGVNSVPRGCRWRGGWFDSFLGHEPVIQDNEFGTTVARLPNVDGLIAPGDELLISSPGFDAERGRIFMWRSDNYIAENRFQDHVCSYPSYASCQPSTCTEGDPAICIRCWVPLPAYNTIAGEQQGDRFGYAVSAGDFNQDGTPDILAGAPGASRPPPGSQSSLSENGIVYLFAIPNGGFGNTDLGTPQGNTIPRVKIIGSHDNDHFGMVQTSVQDINGGSVEDVAIGAPNYDDTRIAGSPKVDAGFVGVIFGNRPITGEQGFAPESIGTAALAGVKFFGVAAGAKAGFDVDSAGDFNQDGYGDLLITSPGETRVVNGQNRLGVAYLIFGGPHLNPHVGGPAGNAYNLSQVGVADAQGHVALPGIVFISRFQQGTIDEAPLETCGGVGDVDGDGFDDIMLGAPHADFVNLASPDQRRPDAGEAYLIYGNNFGSNHVGP
jgi:hypothetical protein